MKNNKFIFFCITVCCMMTFSFNGIFAQGTLGEYPGAGVGFDAGCAYPDAGSNELGFTDMGIPGNACGSVFDVTFGPWVETATGFDISGFELNNFDVDTEATYGIRLFYGPQDNCCTICLDAMLDLSQNQPCGTFGPQADLSVFGYPVPTNYGADIFGDDVIPYDNMCPNTEYFVTYQFISATDVDLNDPDGNLCAMDDALINNFGTMSAVQTLVAPGARSPIVINAVVVSLAGAADCGADVVLDYNIDIASGCATNIGTCSKGLEYEFRATLSCADGTMLNINSGTLLNNPDECYAGTSTVPGGGTGQITLGTVAEVCAIATCDPNASIELYARHTFCEADDINGDGSGVDEAVASIDLVDILAAYGDAGAMCCPSDVPGCTDPCAPNYDATATIDDGSCDPYDDTCNADCTAGPFGGTWDPDTCACINETAPISGCTDDTAINYDPNANCDDGSCMPAVPGCTDPCDPAFDPASTDDTLCQGYDDTCNADCTAGPFGGTWDPATCACINETVPVSGCTDDTATNYDPNANCDDGTCTNAVPGCTDPCAPNYNPDATTDDGTCDPYDDTCNADCTAGPFGGTWDPATCACINETAPINGCTDATATNYDPNANCDDGTCMNAVLGCTDPCASNYNPDATTDDGTCDPYDDTCNVDCTAGPFGGTWDPATCACINETAPVSGCTDPMATNYDPAANCDDGSCMTAPVCSISASATSTCDNNGTPDDVTDDVTTYTVTVSGTDTGAGFTASVAPDAGTLTYGTPLTYTVTGNAGLSVVFTDDTDTTCTATLNQNSGCIDIGEVPTVGEWGLIILGLMMSITAIVGIRQRREEEATA